MISKIFGDVHVGGKDKNSLDAIAYLEKIKEELKNGKVKIIGDPPLRTAKDYGWENKMTREIVIEILKDLWEEGADTNDWIEVKNASIAVDNEDLIIYTSNTTYSTPFSVIEEINIIDDNIEIHTTTGGLFRLEGVIE